MFGLAKKSKLNRYSAQRISLLKNQLTSLFEFGYICTTEKRAKSIKGLVDKIITKAKKNNLHNDRQIISILNQNSDNLTKVKNWLQFPGVLTRNSGYTSIKRLSYRKGDGAILSCIRIII